MATTYSMASNDAYRKLLNVRPAGQRWFSFDVSMPDARKGTAQRFGMTVWNTYRTDGYQDSYSWRRDPLTGAYWYPIPKIRQGVTTNNRKSLWDALVICTRMPRPFPMKAVLKDGKTRRCAPDYVFDISDVKMQADGAALWIRLDVPDGDAGTEVAAQDLPPMVDIAAALTVSVGDQDAVGHRTLTDEQYLAIRESAARVHLDGSSREAELQTLAHGHGHGINPNTAGALLNNFGNLLSGDGFRTPMRDYGLQTFIDAIIARLGDSVVPKVVASIEAFLKHATETLHQESPGYQSILHALREEMNAVTLMEAIQTAAQGLTGSDAPGAGEAASTAVTDPSEILRAVWVRGPQHAAFRRELLRRWGGRCSVHGSRCNDQLRASHIVGWALDESLRGDVDNGLLLSVPLDNLFDRGLISFDDDGVVILSSTLGIDTREHFGLSSTLKIAWEHLTHPERSSIRSNLARHRALHEL